MGPTARIKYPVTDIGQCHIHSKRPLLLTLNAPLSTESQTRPLTLKFITDMQFKEIFSSLPKRTKAQGTETQDESPPRSEEN